MNRLRNTALAGLAALVAFGNSGCEREQSAPLPTQQYAQAQSAETPEGASPNLALDKEPKQLDNLFYHSNPGDSSTYTAFISLGDRNVPIRSTVVCLEEKIYDINGKRLLVEVRNTNGHEGLLIPGYIEKTEINKNGKRISEILRVPESEKGKIKAMLESEGYSSPMNFW